MREIKFGWFLPPQALTEIKNGDTFVDQIMRGMEAIKGKFDSVWMPDHFHPLLRGSRADAEVLECMTTIAYLAGIFPEFDFGSIVLGQSYRNPAMVAKMGATLQALTGGRFILGIGAGWKQDEYLAYNYDYPSNAVRIAQLDEAVQIIQKMWSETQASFEGAHYQIRDAYCEPKPTPQPPIMIGGGGEQLTLRVVAKRADWWNFIFGDQASFSHKLSVLQNHCENVGRDFDEITKTYSHILVLTETEAEAERIAKDMHKAVVGTPDQIVEMMLPFVEMGVEHFMFSFDDFPDLTSMNLFSEQVIPKLR